MSEYWKSTPKIWCKHCKTYVRDTKLEKANHDATPKHQGNLKRFLRDLHRNHENSEKDKERAKSEIARLKGLPAKGDASSSSSSGFGRGPIPSIPKPQATAADRKRQLAQLAEMGISVPDELRPEMAMPGEWIVSSQRVIEEDEGEKKPEAIALGVRKREVKEEEEELKEVKKKRWESSHRTYPTAEEQDGDLDALLNNVTRKGKELETIPKVETDTESKPLLETKTDFEGRPLPSNKTESASKDTTIPELKKEASDGANHLHAIPPDTKQEEVAPVGTDIVFKKRKAKNIRQK